MPDLPAIDRFPHERVTTDGMLIDVREEELPGSVSIVATERVKSASNFYPCRVAVAWVVPA